MGSPWRIMEYQDRQPPLGKMMNVRLKKTVTHEILEVLPSSAICGQKTLSRLH
jgi:hypothetical protein